MGDLSFFTLQADIFFSHNKVVKDFLHALEYPVQLGLVVLLLGANSKCLGTQPGLGRVSVTVPAQLGFITGWTIPFTSSAPQPQGAAFAAFL